MEGNNLEHHNRYKYCKTRLEYRRSKELTAVKVYTVSNESKHLLVFGVPKINLRNELKCLLIKFGTISFIKCITNEIIKNPELNFEIEQFTDVYHVKFENIRHARKAKKFLDAKSMYGGILHFSYAPEYEDLKELRQKIHQRKKDIYYRIQYGISNNYKKFTIKRKFNNSD